MQDPIEGRIYTRRGGRFYADFRDFAAVGGRQEALKPPGSNRATTDPEEASRLAERRMAELEALRVTPASQRQLPRTLAAYGEHHVRALRTEDRVTEQWLENIGRHLAAARGFFGDGASLAEIDPARVRSYQHALAGRPNGRGGTLGGGSQRQYLATLSALYARAIEEGVPGVVRNPVAQLRHKPRARRREADFLEVWEAALLIRAAETLRRARDDGSETPGLGAIVATYLLTGARSQEVRGLEVGDVSFERRRIFIRNNAHRRLKTLPSARPVPLWPQLEAILRAHLEARGWPRSGLLFPRSEAEPEAMITDLRRALDAAGARIGMPEGRVRTLLFRHSYCAARLQSVDGAGYPVATETVSREMGHGGRQMVERIYGHVAGAPHRSDVVEYRTEQWTHLPEVRAALARLTAEERLHEPDLPGGAHRVIERARRELDLSYRRVAELLGAHESSLHLWRAGSVAPGAEYRTQLAVLDAALDAIRLVEDQGASTGAPASLRLLVNSGRQSEAIETAARWRQGYSSSASVSAGRFEPSGRASKRRP